MQRNHSKVSEEQKSFWISLPLDLLYAVMNHKEKCAELPGLTSQ
jgi:hypothetical protein